MLVFTTRTYLKELLRQPYRSLAANHPQPKSVYTTHTLSKATTIISDSTHPANHFFESLASGKRFISIKTRTTCFNNSFYPKAIQTKSPNTKSKEQEERKEDRKGEKENKTKKEVRVGVCVWGGGGGWGG